MNKKEKNIIETFNDGDYVIMKYHKMFVIGKMNISIMKRYIDIDIENCIRKNKILNSNSNKYKRKYCIHFKTYYDIIDYNDKRSFFKKYCIHGKDKEIVLKKFFMKKVMDRLNG